MNDPLSLELTKLYVFFFMLANAYEESNSVHFQGSNEVIFKMTTK